MKLLESRTPAKLAALEAEERYRAAQTRFLAARQEKREATDEFLVARAALRDCLDTKRPAPARVRAVGPFGGLGRSVTRA